MSDFFVQFTYIAVFIAIIARGFGIPLPEDIPLLMSGYLVARELCSLHFLGPIAFVAVLVADSISYAIGWRFGHHVPRIPLIRHILTEQRLKQAEHTYHRHGKKTICVARFMPGVRSPIFFVAGAFRIPFGNFLLIDGITAIFSVSFLIFLGWFFASSIEWIQEVVKDMRIIFGVGVIAVVAFAVFIRKRRRNKQRQFFT